MKHSVLIRLAFCTFFFGLAASESLAQRADTFMVLSLDDHTKVVGATISRDGESLTIFDFLTSTEMQVPVGSIENEAQIDLARSAQLAPVENILTWKLNSMDSIQEGKVTEIRDGLVYVDFPFGAVQKGDKVGLENADRAQTQAYGHLEVVVTNRDFAILSPIENLDLNQVRVGDRATARAAGAIAVLGVPDETVSRVQNACIQTGIKVVERTHLLPVLAEIGLQQSRLFDDQTAVRVGRQVGAKRLVLVRQLETSSEAKVLDVETGELNFVVLFPKDSSWNTGSAQSRNIPRNTTPRMEDANWPPNEIPGTAIALEQAMINSSWIISADGNKDYIVTFRQGGAYEVDGKLQPKDHRGWRTISGSVFEFGHLRHRATFDFGSDEFTFSGTYSSRSSGRENSPKPNQRFVGRHR